MENRERTQFQFKGIRDGLLVVIGDGIWSDLQQDLLNQIEEQASFLKGARLVLDVGNHALKAADLGTLRNHLSDQNVNLFAILSSSPLTEQNSQALGLATRLSVPRKERVIKSLDTSVSTGEEAVLLQKTLRSGFQVNSSGHVIVIGDVNPGAEIRANGNVVIWGKLRGSVHAGADGNENAQVCALDLSPMLLRIGELEFTAPRKWGKSQPAVCKISEGRIIAEPWNPKAK